MASDGSFRFSPRPNTAGSIPWRPFGEAAFEEAGRQKKPVLLSLSAVWCHWCHVMDEGTYSDLEVQAAIARDFIAVRVDSDQRPDVNDRYNLGGWPTTAFLAPSGEVLAGGTYLPAGDMLESLRRVAAWWRAHGDEPLPKAPPAAAVDKEADDLVAMLIAGLCSAFDEEHGGFGRAPKFPQVDALFFLLAIGRNRRDPTLTGMVEASLLAMVDGGLFDPIEGGFFRYATHRDWSEPHYEKMLEDNARLVLLLSHLARESALLEQAARASGEYLVTTLFTGDHFFGSQDADEVYYHLGMTERRGRESPFRDPVLYAGWNAVAARCLAEAGCILGQPAWLEAARSAFRSIAERCLGPDGLAHTDQPGALTNALADVAALGRAADLFWGLDRDPLAAAVAERLAEILQTLRTPDGFRDRPPGGVGRLADPVYDLPANAAAGRFLLERRDAASEEAPSDGLDEALAAIRRLAPSHGVMAAAGAHLAWLVTREPVRIEVPPDAAPELLAAALEAELPRRVVVPGQAPGVVLCLGDRCLLPASRPDEMKGRLAEIRDLTGGS